MSAQPKKILVLRRWSKPTLDLMVSSENFKCIIAPQLPGRQKGRLPTNMMLDKTRVPSAEWTADDVRLFAGMITILNSDRVVQDVRKAWLDLVASKSGQSLSKQDKDAHFYTCDDANVVAHISKLLDETMPLYRGEFNALFMVASFFLGPRRCPLPEKKPSVRGKRKRKKRQWASWVD